MPLPTSPPWDYPRACGAYPVVFTKQSGFYAIKSFFGRNSDLSLTKSLMLHDVLYINKEKTTEWQYSGRQQLPMALSIRGSFKNIPDEKELVKLKNKYPKLYQQMQDATSLNLNGQYLISLFSAADESTIDARNGSCLAAPA